MAKRSSSTVAADQDKGVGQPVARADVAVKKRKLSPPPPRVVDASESDPHAEVQAASDNALQAATKLDKGKAKKRRKELQKALVSLSLSLPCREQSLTITSVGEPAELLVRHARVQRREDDPSKGEVSFPSRADTSLFRD